MVVAWVATGAQTQKYTSALSMSVGVPAGYSAGNLLLMVVSTIGGPTLVTPSGWAKLGEAWTGVVVSGATSGIYWKIAGSSESSVTVTTTTAPYAGIMFAFSGTHTTVPFDASEWAVTTSDQNNNGGRTKVHPTVTPAVADSGLVLVRNITTTTSGTMTSTGGTVRSQPTITGSGSNRPTCGVVTLDGGFTGPQSYDTSLSDKTSSGSNEWSILVRPSSSADKSSVGILYG